ncbi:3-hydroxyacyl-CoA dehydrogenase family protein [Kitasatospora sp. NBC_01266]|uniref:3-hydroxyacyl-CoA dehydrogenase family protein n=1 Tax=Kitasatospora sp. NBC_01266 TaxID=2903572 RepID=UPI002E328F98|nr:3-hydroxyacyl-CoA dehydrogenase family protein [Kitasatospora sp. NBC_01266]
MNQLTLGIVGAGVIGSSLAQAVLDSGLDVVLHDNDPQALANAEQRMATERRMARLGGRRPAAEGTLTLATELSALAAADLVVENIVEDEAAKTEVHRRLDQVLAPRTVVAVNTSAVPVTSLALATDHPDRVLGAHFMNPVGLTTMVEAVRTPHTAPWAVEALRDLLARMGKSTVVVDDAPGFVINRCLMIFVNEAAALLDDGVASPLEVDRLFQGCLGHRSGPLRTADLIGVDTVVRTLEVLARQFGAEGARRPEGPQRPERFEPCARLRRMVADGHLGRKSGHGFFTYPELQTI